MRLFSSFLTYPIFEEFIFWIKQLWFLWLPAISAFLFWKSWLGHVRAGFLNNLSWVLLEIRVPRDIAKGPRAMEVVLSSLYSTFAGTWRARVMNGFLPSWYSLEIASINGKVHFFIRVQRAFRNLAESQVYAQYADAEIVEIDDYAYASDFEDFEQWNLWGGEFGLTKEDGYPIRTYIDFGLHETMTKEEQKVNPLVSFLEFLGSLKEGEQIWFQVMIKGTGKKWTEESKKLIDKLMGRDKAPGDSTNESRLSKGEQEAISAIEKNISKTGFDTGIRVVYLARRDMFNMISVASVFGLMNQYNAQNLNGFKLANSTASGFLFRAKRELFKKKIMLNAYRQRGYFYAPHKRKHFVFNTEELATIYHFPGRVAETPTFARVEAKKGEPPPTLPI